MGSQVSSITCVALTQQQPLPQMPLQELLGKSLKHGTSPYYTRESRRPATTKGVYFNSHSIGPSPRPTNSRETGQDRPSASQPLVPPAGARAELWREGRRLRFRALP